jgi:hypothetical protein
MINSRISGSNAFKLTDENYKIDYNRTNYISSKTRRKHKWRLKESYKDIYSGIGLAAMIVAVPYLTALIFG